MTTNVVSSRKSIQSFARDQEDYVIQIRRDLHRIPELGWKETKTVAYIKARIKELLPMIDCQAEMHEMAGGLYVDITVHPEAERILFRSDIDGLPIEEQTNLPFSSEHAGVMHACGHDCHAAMLLGALRAIAAGIPLKHNLRLVWQRAEEVFAIESGGSKMVEEGVCCGISRAYGLHVSSPHETGVFFSRPGNMMSNAAHLCVEISCTGGHVMRPDLGANAIDILTEIQVALRDFVSRTLPPDEPIIFVPSVANAGQACNIMPNHAMLWYSVRNFLGPRKLHTFLKALTQKISTVVSGFPDSQIASLRMHQGFPILTNDPNEHIGVEKKLKKQGYRVKTSPLLYSGEDFSYYLDNCPGSFWMLGAKQGPGYDHHTALFNPDESALVYGVAFWLALL